MFNLKLALTAWHSFYICNIFTKGANNLSSKLLWIKAICLFWCDLATSLPVRRRPPWSRFPGAACLCASPLWPYYMHGGVSHIGEPVSVTSKAVEYVHKQHNNVSRNVYLRENMGAVHSSISHIPTPKHRLGSLIHFNLTTNYITLKADVLRPITIHCWPHSLPRDCTHLLYAIIWLSSSPIVTYLRLYLKVSAFLIDGYDEFVDIRDELISFCFPESISTLL